MYNYVITPQQGIYLIYKHKPEAWAYKSDIARVWRVITNLCIALKPYFKGIMQQLNHKQGLHQTSK